MPGGGGRAVPEREGGDALGRRGRAGDQSASGAARARTSSSRSTRSTFRPPSPARRRHRHPPAGRDGCGSRGASCRGLSEKEIAVLVELCQGHTNKQIAAQLWLSEQTVKFHLRNVYRKLGIKSRTEALRYAYEHDLAGLVSAPPPDAGRVSRAAPRSQGASCPTLGRRTKARSAPERHRGLPRAKGRRRPRRRRPLGPRSNPFRLGIGRVDPRGAGG